MSPDTHDERRDSGTRLKGSQNNLILYKFTCTGIWISPKNSTGGNSPTDSESVTGKEVFPSL